MSQKESQVRRVFPGRYEQLAEIRDFVLQAARQVGFTNQALYAVELAVDEACTNIIEHAYEGEDRGEINCCLEITPNRLCIELRDQGRPFDPNAVPQPDLNLPLKKLKSRGVGLYLMRKLMDEVSYTTSPEEGNVMRLVKKK